jgi:hypothetical protein
VALVYKAKNTTVGIRHADHVAPSIRKKLALTSLTSGGRSVGIVRLWTEATVFFFFYRKNGTFHKNLPGNDVLRNK